MAEKRKAGFNIPLNFYDGPEVESIPRRIRAAAIGVWALAGNYAATQLTDGYVPAGILKSFGCTEAIRAALKVTINKKGELSPLWVDARNGGVQLTNWPKHQRTNDEVTTYRAKEAERKRLAREAQADEDTPNLSDNFAVTSTNLSDNFAEDTSQERDNNGPTTAPEKPSASGKEKMSGRTSTGHAPTVRSDARDPKTKTETKTENSSGYVDDDTHLSTARDVVVPEHIDTPSKPPRRHPSSAAKTLVRQVLGNHYPRTHVNRLAIQVEKLTREGHPDTLIRQALTEWERRPNCDKPEFLPTVLGDVVKQSRAAPTITPGEAKVLAWAELASPTPDQRKALGQ